MRLYPEFLTHPSPDYWRPLQFAPEDFANIIVPALTVTGWYDGDQAGALFYVTGVNEWRSYDAYPRRSVSPRKLYLTSGGHANSLCGGGKLSWRVPAVQRPDTFRYDPRRPVPGYVREELLTPEKIESFMIDLNDVAHRFRTGHRVRLDVSSSTVPLYNPNQNTDDPIPTETAWRVAKQSVHHDRVHASFISLPVMAGSHTPCAERRVGRHDRRELE
jgi:predicted acyl esterase